jgi:anaerobic glycerol-3-phosphate dehydrogenase
VVGFAGFRDFAPGLCARGLRDGGHEASPQTVDLPTWNHERNFTTIDLARAIDDHPLGAAGVAVDPELRPLGADGSPALGGLRCVGSLLADHDPTAEGSREGVALATATRVAERLTAAPV